MYDSHDKQRKPVKILINKLLATIIQVSPEVVHEVKLISVLN